MSESSGRANLYLTNPLSNSSVIIMKPFWEGRPAPLSSSCFSPLFWGTHQSGEKQGEEPAKAAPGGGMDFYYGSLPRGGC